MIKYDIANQNNLSSDHTVVFHDKPTGVQRKIGGYCFMALPAARLSTHTPAGPQPHGRYPFLNSIKLKAYIMLNHGLQTYCSGILKELPIKRIWFSDQWNQPYGRVTCNKVGIKILDIFLEGRSRHNWK